MQKIYIVFVDEPEEKLPVFFCSKPRSSTQKLEKPPIMKEMMQDSRELSEIGVLTT